MLRFAAALLLLLSCSTSLLHSQSISGTVNDYAQVISLSGADITVGSAAAFSVGDRVVVIQMKGATIDQTNSANYGDVLNYNDAGNFEFSNVVGIAGNVVTLSSILCNTYDPTGRVQLIRIPVYPNPTVSAPLTGQSWNGITGGVIVLETPGTLTLNADIDADGLGFRGGTFQSGGFSCADAAYSSPFGQGGEKGEGIADYLIGQTCSRGKLANGGGGSNRGNSGGGGGGNGGVGGIGGNIYNGCGASTIQGVGGVQIAQVQGKAFLGGGGGGGFRDNGQNCTPGEAGGGIVILLAPNIAGNNNSILANGRTQNLVANDEGAGGGGAGGSVLLFTANFTSALTVSTEGGKGGDTFNNIFSGNCHGPGGGAGGGLLWLVQPSLPANVTHNTNGGLPGLVTNPSQPCFNTSFGATGGANGQSLFNLNPSLLAVVPSLGPDTTICQGATLTLDAGTGFVSYLWQDGSANQTFATGSAGQYWVQGTSTCGVATDTINVAVSPLPVPALGIDTTICSGTSLVLNPGSFSGYLWQDGSTNPTFTVTTPGPYSVTVTNAAGCTAADTIVVGVALLPVISLGADFSICTGQDSVLDPGAGFINYTWQDGSMNQTFTASTAGAYWVTVTDGFGCQDADTVNMSFFVLPTVNLGPDQSICFGNNATFDAGPGQSAYVWQDASSNQTLTTSTTGNYAVTVTDANGCQNSDDANLTVNPLPVVNLGPDQDICQGATFTFDAGPGLSYVWQDGSVNQTFTTGTAGNYAVTVTDANGCQSNDDANLTVNPLPTPTLGPDFLLCQGGNQLIFPTGGSFTGFLWQDGSTASNFTVSGPGLYSVTVTDVNGCQASDDVLVTPGMASVDLGNDTNLCAGTSALFSAGNGFANYSWSDGSSGSYLVASAAGDYAVTVTGADGCSASDTASILFVGTFPVVDLGPDTILCAGTTVTLDAGQADTYAWGNGATSQTITVPASVGLYVVTATNFPGCSTMDDFRVTAVLPQPTAGSLMDQSLCVGDSAIFDAGPIVAGETYSWSDGSSGPSITVFDEGNYSVTVTNSCGTVSSSASVPPLLFPPSPFIGPDTVICDDPMTLSALTNADSYLWNGLTSITFFEIFDPGLYWVDATNQCGTVSDTILVTEQCEPRLYFPNAFSPNQDGRNDFFGPTGEGVEEFDLQIFDRWGKLIFVTQDRFATWDGKFGGQPLPEGVYVYQANFRYQFRGETKELNRQGTVTLIR